MSFLPPNILKFAADVIRNMSHLFLAQVASRAISFLYMVYLAAKLPTDRFGSLGIALTILIVADTVADVGLSRLTVRTMARQTGPQMDYPGGLIPLRVLLSILVYSLCLALVVFGGFDSDVRVFVAIIGTGLALTGLASILEAALQARSRFAFVGFAHAALSVVQAASGVLAIHLGWSISAFAATFLVSNLAYVLMLLAAILKIAGKLPLRIDPTFWQSQLAAALPYAGTAILIIFSMRCELLVMSLVSTPAQVAYFSVAARLNDAAVLAPLVLSTVLVPIYSRRLHEAPDQLAQAYVPVLKWGLVSAVPAALLGCLLIEPAILYFLPAYKQSIGFAQIMFAAMPLFAVLQLNQAVLLGSDQQGRTMLVLFGLTVLQVMLGLSLIIPYAAQGGALSYAVWALAAAVISTLLTRKWYMRSLSLLKVVVPAVAGTLAACAVLWLTWDLGMAIKLSASAIIYGAIVGLTARLFRSSEMPIG